MKTYPPKRCLVCGAEWQPRNRYQATRNKTCGPQCAARSTSRNKTGKLQPQRWRHQMVPCAMCGKVVKRELSRLKRILEVFCGHHCAGLRRAETLIRYSGNMKGRKRTDARKGADNPAWKGGVTYFRKHGNYKPIKYVRCPAEFLPMARKDGYVMEHRLIVARFLGRCLARLEVVHHRNHDPQDNRPENLQLFPNNRAHKLAEGFARSAAVSLTG